MTDQLRPPKTSGELTNDDSLADGIGETMMLEPLPPPVVVPGAAVPVGRSPFEDDEPPYVADAFTSASGVESGAPPFEAELADPMELMGFGFDGGGDDDDKTMMEFDDAPDERTVFEHEDDIAAAPTVPPVVAQPAFAQAVPVAVAAPVAIPAAVAVPAPVAVAIPAPVAVPVAVAMPQPVGFGETLDALADEEDDDSIMSSVGPGPAARMFGGQRARANKFEEPTMLELDADELEEVEPSRLVPIPHFDDDSAPPQPIAPPGGYRSTLFGSPGVAAPAPVPVPVRTVSPRMPAPAQAMPARATVPPPTDRAAPLQNLSTPAAITPPRKKNNKLILIIGSLLIAAAGAAAVIILDPFGKAPAVAVPVGPPTVQIVSDPAIIEVFDHGAFVGETPIKHESAAEGHDLQIVGKTGSYRIKTPSLEGASSMFIQLPPKGKAKLGHLILKGHAGATVRAGEQVLGKTPLLYIAPVGHKVQFQFELAAEKGTAEGTVAQAGATLDVVLQ